MAYPRLVFQITDGNTTKNINVDHAKTPVDVESVKYLGSSFAAAYGTDFNFVQASLISDSVVATND